MRTQRPGPPYGSSAPLLDQKLKMGTVHPGRVVNICTPIGAFINFEGPSNGLYRGADYHGLTRGQEVFVKIIKAPRWHSIKKVWEFELGLVEAPKTPKPDIIDRGKFWVLPKTNGLIPKHLFPDVEKVSEIKAEDSEVEIDFDGKPHKLLVPQGLGDVIESLAKGEPVSLKIGTLEKIDGRHINWLQHPNFPNLILGKTEIPLFWDQKIHPLANFVILRGTNYNVQEIYHALFSALADKVPLSFYFLARHNPIPCQIKNFNPADPYTSIDLGHQSVRIPNCLLASQKPEETLNVVIAGEDNGYLLGFPAEATPLVDALIRSIRSGIETEIVSNPTKKRSRSFKELPGYTIRIQSGKISLDGFLKTENSLIIGQKVWVKVISDDFRLRITPYFIILSELINNFLIFELVG